MYLPGMNAAQIIEDMKREQVYKIKKKCPYICEDCKIKEVCDDRNEGN